MTRTPHLTQRSANRSENCNHKQRGRRRRALLASATALSLCVQNVAWAVCSDGSNLPAGGFVVGRDQQVLSPANFSPNVFTAPAGSLFIPDASINEHNDPSQPLTGGGHNWVFDQGSTLCKVTDTGPAGQRATGWNIPPNTSTDCVILPIIKGGRITNIGDIPFQGQVITPTCNPAVLASATNTYFNQLGCSISHGKATTPRSATSFMFVTGIKGGLFSIQLDNVGSAVVGGTAGKTVGPQNYYSDIPEGQKLTSGAISSDGHFAMATSLRREQQVFACLNPLGDPGDPTQPINPNFFVPPGSLVKCMIVGNNNLQTNLTSVFGPDGQPYFGGQRVVTSFDSQPGGASPAAWPQCITKGAGASPAALAAAFNSHNAGGCGNAQGNFGFTSALVTQPSAFATHVAPNGDKYMYTGPVGGTTLQFKLKIDPASGMTTYTFRTYLTGTSLSTGFGIADDLTYPGGTGGSLMVMTDPSSVGLAGQGVMTKLPLCEDMR